MGNLDKNFQRTTNQGTLKIQNDALRIAYIQIFLSNRDRYFNNATGENLIAKSNTLQEATVFLINE